MAQVITVKKDGAKYQLYIGSMKLIGQSFKTEPAAEKRRKEMQEDSDNGMARIEKRKKLGIKGRMDEASFDARPKRNSEWEKKQYSGKSKIGNYRGFPYFSTTRVPPNSTKSEEFYSSEVKDRTGKVHRLLGWRSLDKLKAKIDEIVKIGT